MRFVWTGKESTCAVACLPTNRWADSQRFTGKVYSAEQHLDDVEVCNLWKIYDETHNKGTVQALAAGVWPRLVAHVVSVARSAPYGAGAGWPVAAIRVAWEAADLAASPAASGQRVALASHAVRALPEALREEPEPRPAGGHKRDPGGTLDPGVPRKRGRAADRSRTPEHIFRIFGSPDHLTPSPSYPEFRSQA